MFLYVHIRTYDSLNNYSLKLWTIFIVHRAERSNFSLIPVGQQIEDFFTPMGDFEVQVKSSLV